MGRLLPVSFVQALLEKIAAVVVADSIDGAHLLGSGWELLCERSAKASFPSSTYRNSAQQPLGAHASFFNDSCGLRPQVVRKREGGSTLKIAARRIFGAVSERALEDGEFAGVHHSQRNFTL